MRPRKKVAVYNSDAIAAARLSYVLRLRLRVAPTECFCIDDLIAADHEVAILMPSDVRQVQDLRQAYKLLPAKKLLLDRNSLCGTELPVNLRLDHTASSAEILKAVRLLLICKRGPKPPLPRM